MTDNLNSRSIIYVPSSRVSSPKNQDQELFEYFDSNDVDHTEVLVFIGSITAIKVVAYIGSIRA